MEGEWTSTAIRGQVNQLHRPIEETTFDYDREKLQKRRAKLTDGVAVINVSAATETEMKQKKTPSMRPVRPWKRESSPAAARP